jgi:hypothetical protein
MTEEAKTITANNVSEEIARRIDTASSDGTIREQFVSRRVNIEINKRAGLLITSSMVR